MTRQISALSCVLWADPEHDILYGSQQLAPAGQLAGVICISEISLGDGHVSCVFRASFILHAHPLRPTAPALQPDSCIANDASMIGGTPVAAPASLKFWMYALHAEKTPSDLSSAVTSWLSVTCGGFQPPLSMPQLSHHSGPLGASGVEGQAPQVLQGTETD